jgi:hypothetical protein
MSAGYWRCQGGGARDRLIKVLEGNGALKMELNERQAFKNSLRIGLAWIAKKEGRICHIFR